MTKTTVVKTQVESELKAEVEAVLDELGLTVSQAIMLYFKQIALQRGIPFPLQLPQSDSEIPPLLDMVGIVQSGYADTSAKVAKIVADSISQKYEE